MPSPWFPLVRRGRWAGALLLAWSVALVSRGQSPTWRADTAAVLALIREGQALEPRQPTAALATYQRALTTAERVHFAQGYFKTMGVLTFALNKLGRHDEARALALRGLARAQQDTSTYGLGMSHFALAVTAWRQGDLREAVRGYHAAETSMRALHNTFNLNIIHNNLAIIYQQQGLYAQARAELTNVLELQRAAGLAGRDLAITLFNIGTNYWYQRNGPQAKRYFRLTRQHLDPQKDPDVLISLFNNVGQVFLAEARQVPPARRGPLYDSCLYYHRRALALSRQTHNPIDELHELNALAGVYIDQRRWAIARPLLRQALAMAQRHGQEPTELKAIYKEYVNLNERQHNYEAAFRWQARYAKIDSTLDNQDTKDLLESYKLQARQADAKVRLQAKQAQINRLRNEQSRQRLWLWLAAVAAASGAALLLLGLLYYRQRQRTHAAALLALQREQDLLAVHAEVQGQTKERVRIAKEMHDDMGASLTVIGLLSEVMKTRPETAAAPEVGKISELSTDLIATMNQVIWSLNPSNDSLNGLVAYIRVYAREFLDNTALHLRIEAEEAETDVRIDGDDRRNLFLAVKEALHNVVKHAGATRVTLRLRARDGALGVEVCDDGRGFAAGAPAPKAGRNGLANMAHRLREAGGTCEVHAAAGGGTCVVLRYPYPVPAPAAKILQV